MHARCSRAKPPRQSGLQLDSPYPREFVAAPGMSRRVLDLDLRGVLCLREKTTIVEDPRYTWAKKTPPQRGPLIPSGALGIGVNDNGIGLRRSRAPLLRQQTVGAILHAIVISLRRPLPRVAPSAVAMAHPCGISATSSPGRFSAA